MNTSPLIKASIYFFIPTLLIGTSYGQGFQKSSNHQGLPFSGLFLNQTETDDILMIGVVSYDSILRTFIQKADDSGNVLWTKSITHLDGTSGIPIGITTLADNSIVAYISYETPFTGWHNYILKLDQSASNIEWVSQVGLDSLFPLASDLIEATSSSIIAAQRTNNNITVSRLTLDGNLTWNYTIQIPEEHFSRPSSLSITPDDKYLLAGNLQIVNQDPSGLLIWLTEDGTITNSKTYQNISLSYSESFSDGTILISGSYSEQAFLAKTDSDGNIEWAKTISSEADETGSSCKAIPSSDGGCIVFLKTNFVDQASDRMLKLDPQGNIEWQRTYHSKLDISNRFPGAIIGSTGYAYTWLDNTQNTILVKADLNGNTGSCPSIATCFYLEDLNITTTTNNWSQTNYQTPATALNLALSDIDVTYDDYCEDFTPPSPVFLVPDSLCINACIDPENLQQQNAESWEWTGANIEFPTAQDPGTLCFDQVGETELQQVVYYGGCPDSFQTSITVLPIPIVELPNDSVVCEEVSILINATSDNNVTYSWDNLSTSSSREIYQPGTYNVTVSNGYCESTDSVEILFLNDVIDFNALELGEDTSICTGYEFLIGPEVSLFDDFLWNDGNEESPRSIRMEGTYSYSAFIEGCLFSDTIYISTENCDGSIYIPNVFSPNADGNNDFFTAYGNHHLIESFKIFDRWGGLIWATNSDESWDGTSNGQDVQNGIYVYLLQYTDTRTLRKKLKSGDVMLIR